MAQFGLTCNGDAVTSASQLEGMVAALDPSALVEIRCPVVFPETSIELRDILRELGFGALTIEVRGYLFTAVHGFIPNMERWRRACGPDRVPAADSGRVAISSRARALPACDLLQAIAQTRAVALTRHAPVNSPEIPARICSGLATPLDAATWSALTIIAPTGAIK
jgi:hypothetical protein